MIFLTITLVLSLVFALLELKGISPKTSKIFFMIGSFLIFVMMGLNRNNPDYKGYYTSFQNGNLNYDIGYRLMANAINKLHLPFEMIMVLMSVLLLVVLWFGLRGSYSNWVIFFYSVFPLALDVPQVRNSFMYLLVLLTLFVFAHRSKFGFFIGVLIASSMHALGALYLPLTFLFKAKRHTFYKWIGWLFAGLLVGVLGLRIANVLWALHPEIVEEIKPFDRFFFVTQVVEIGIDLFTYWWIDRTIRSRIDEGIDQRIEPLYRFGWYSALYIPALIVHGQMYRFRRNAQLVKYVYFAIASKHLNRNEKLIAIGMILLNLLLVIALMILANDHSVYTFFDYNWLFYRFQNIVQ